MSASRQSDYFVNYLSNVPVLAETKDCVVRAVENNEIGKLARVFNDYPLQGDAKDGAPFSACSPRLIAEWIKQCKSLIKHNIFELIIGNNVTISIKPRDNASIQSNDTLPKLISSIIDCACEAILDPQGNLKREVVQHLSLGNSLNKDDVIFQLIYSYCTQIIIANLLHPLSKDYKEKNQHDKIEQLGLFTMACQHLFMDSDENNKQAHTPYFKSRILTHHYVNSVYSPAGCVNFLKLYCSSSLKRIVALDVSMANNVVNFDKVVMEEKTKFWIEVMEEFHRQNDLPRLLAVFTTLDILNEKIIDLWVKVLKDLYAHNDSHGMLLVLKEVRHLSTAVTSWERMLSLFEADLRDLVSGTCQTIQLHEASKYKEIIEKYENNDNKGLQALVIVFAENASPAFFKELFSQTNADLHDLLKAKIESILLQNEATLLKRRSSIKEEDLFIKWFNARDNRIILDHILQYHARESKEKCETLAELQNIKLTPQIQLSTTELIGILYKQSANKEKMISLIKPFLSPSGLSYLREIVAEEFIERQRNPFSLFSHSSFTPIPDNIAGELSRYINLIDKFLAQISIGIEVKKIAVKLKLDLEAASNKILSPISSTVDKQTAIRAIGYAFNEAIIKRLTDVEKTQIKIRDIISNATTTEANTQDFILNTINEEIEERGKVHKALSTFSSGTLSIKDIFKDYYENLAKAIEDYFPQSRIHLVNTFKNAFIQKRFALRKTDGAN